MRYFVLSFLCLIAVIAYVQRLGVQTAHAPIEADFEINTEQFGMLGTALLIGYAALQVPAGWLADRIGPRNALVLFAILWSLITASIGLCERFEVLLAVWFAMGMALAGVFPCAAKSIGAWFPDTERATASGLLGSFTMLGTAIASLLTSQLLIEAGWSWRWIYAVYGAAGVVWALLYLAIVPERSGTQTSAAPMTPGDWGTMATSLPLWLLCGQQFFRAGAMIFFINWFPKFLKESRGFAESEAGLFAAVVNASALIGGVLGGVFSDQLLRITGRRRLSRQGIAVAGMAGCAILILATKAIHDGENAIVLFCLGAFIASFGGVSGYTVAIEFGGKRIGVVFSVMNMCGNFGGAIVNQAVGSLKERTGSWDIALYAVAVIFAVDAVCWALLNPQRPLFEDPVPDEVVPETGIRAGDPPIRRTIKDDSSGA
jgi:nitrate/nitrite transporter NarK